MLALKTATEVIYLLICMELACLVLRIGLYGSDRGQASAVATIVYLPMLFLNLQILRFSEIANNTLTQF